ncbi:hypothetical protein [Streptomyces sp. NPDC048442]|uniref:hypothetical protein n=1 Tax=Streptomyces sp. NPDC048442 TaxID=3154823 RepID=UPI0034350D44
MHDIAENRARPLADLTGATVTGGYTQMLDDGLVDALVVCTPHALHVEPAPGGGAGRDSGAPGEADGDQPSDCAAMSEAFQ